MIKFWQKSSITQENDGELERYAPKLRQSLAELECEEAIIEVKNQFGKFSTIDSLKKN